MGGKKDDNGANKKIIKRKLDIKKLKHKHEEGLKKNQDEIKKYKDEIKKYKDEIKKNKDEIKKLALMKILITPKISKLI